MPDPTPGPVEDPTEMDGATFKRRMLALAYWLARNAATIGLTFAVAWIGGLNHRAINRAADHAEKAHKAAEATHEVVRLRYAPPPKE